MPKYGLTLVTPQSGEIYLASDQTLLDHLRVDPTDTDSALITAYIQAAREYVETVTARQLLTAQWLYSVDAFPGVHEDEYRPPGWRYGIIRLPKAPLVSVDQVQYIDWNGTLQILQPTNDPITNGGYQVSTRREPGVLAPQRFTVWPLADPQSLDCVRVTFTAGYGTADQVPERIKQAVRMMVGHLWENREATIEAALACVPYGLESFVRSCGYAEYV